MSHKDTNRVNAAGPLKSVFNRAKKHETVLAKHGRQVKVIRNRLVWIGSPFSLKRRRLQALNTLCWDIRLDSKPSRMPSTLLAGT